MKGWVTWLGIGAGAVIAGYEAIIESNPELAAIIVTVGTIVVGVARKIEKLAKAFQEK